jgi:hypothetical protein
MEEKQTATSLSLRMTPEQRENLLQEVEKYKAAQRQFTDALAVLWSAQLETVAASGQADLVERVLGRPLGLWDDCSCC